jgi:hypothetical protein
MNKFFILLLVILSVSLYACSSPKGDSSCNSACLEKGFSEGKCETLGVIPDPCESGLNKTTIYSQDGYCEEYKRDGQRVAGVGNMCCCT